MFGTDGIRGKWGGDVMNSTVESGIARAISILSEKYKYNDVVIGYDTRMSSPMIFELLCAVFNDHKINIIDCGVLPTNGVSIVTSKYKCFGIMITASHNDYVDNGLKIFNSDGVKIDKHLESEILRIYHSQSPNFFDYTPREKDIEFYDFINKKLRNTDSFVARDYYFSKITDALSKLHCHNGFSSHINILVDFGNGACYKLIDLMQNYLQKIGVTMTAINHNPNGVNINYLCGSNHSELLKGDAKDYDLIFSFDGDGDRVVILDKDGVAYNGDAIIAFLVKNLDCNRSVVHTCMSNSALDDFLRSSFGYECVDVVDDGEMSKVISNKLKQIIITKVGDKNVLSAMKLSGGMIGGEESGHIIADPMQASDSIFVTLLILTLLQSNIAKTTNNLKCDNISSIISKELRLFDNYYQVAKSFYYSSNNPEDLVVDIRKIIAENDGIRSVVRKSGTEDKVRVMIEGKKLNEQLAQEIFNKINQLF